MTERLRVLLVEDSPTYGEVTRAVLARDRLTSFEVDQVPTIADAISELAAGAHDVIVLDLTLPDALGLDGFRTLIGEVPDVPVVILSGAEDDDQALDAVREGAHDFLHKQPAELGLLGRALRYAVERDRMRRQLRAMAHVDELTGLYNRRGFVTVGEHELRRADRDDKPVRVSFIDLDGMKQINDAHGHKEGDRALRDVAALLSSVYRNSDVTARVGGDEFALLAVDGTDRAERLHEAVRRHNDSTDRPFELSVSVGSVVRAPGSGESLPEVMDRADREMYEAKRGKRGTRTSEPPRRA